MLIVPEWTVSRSGHDTVRKVQMERQQGGKAQASNVLLLPWLSSILLLIIESSLEVVTYGFQKSRHMSILISWLFLPQCVGEACKKIRARLNAYQVEAGIVDPSWRELVYSAFSNGVDISERYVYGTCVCFFPFRNSSSVIPLFSLL